jgi:hypothetical protein
MQAYFEEIQEDILHYKERFEIGHITIDKTNEMFHNLSVGILDYLGTGDAELFDRAFEYNIMTMHEEFEELIARGVTNEKAQGTLMMFFLRCAEEMLVRDGKIEHEALGKLHAIMTHKGYKYPDYISTQKRFAIENLADIVKRMQMFDGSYKQPENPKENEESFMSLILGFLGKGSK